MAAGPCTSERWTLLLLLVLSVVFAFCYEIAEDKEGYYVTATWVIGLFFALGASDLLRRASESRSRLLMMLTALLVVGAPLAAGVLNAGGCDRASDIRGPRFVADVTVRTLRVWQTVRQDPAPEQLAGAGAD